MLKKLFIILTLIYFFGYIILAVFKKNNIDKTQSFANNSDTLQFKSKKNTENLLKNPELFIAMEKMIPDASRNPANIKERSSNEGNRLQEIEDFGENIDSMTKNEIFMEYDSSNKKLTEKLKLLEMLDREDENSEARESLMYDIDLQKSKIELLDEHIRPVDNEE